jgi:SET family sugar efflux transporter-like MFS transporter
MQAIAFGSRLKKILLDIFQRRELAALILCGMVLGMVYAFVMPFASLFFTEEVGMSPLLFGGFMTVTTLAGIGVSTVLARWSDRAFSRRRLMAIAGVLGSFSYAGYALTRDPILLFLIGSIPLAVSGVCFSQIFALGRDLLARSDLPKKDAPLYMNVIRISFAVAWMGGPAISSVLVRFQGYQGAYLGASLLFLIFAVMIFWLVPEMPPRAIGQAQGDTSNFLETFRTPGLLGFFLGFTFYSCASTLGMMNLPLLIIKTLSGNESHVGWAYSIAPVFEIPFMYFVGILAIRIDMAVIIRLTMGLAVVYYAGLALIGAPWQVYPLQILSAAIVAVNSGIAITFFQNFMPGKTGTSTNLYANANRLGSLAGFLIFGAVSGPYGHRAIFWVCAGLCGFSLICLYLAAPLSENVVEEDLPSVAI